MRRLAVIVIAVGAGALIAAGGAGYFGITQIADLRKIIASRYDGSIALKDGFFTALRKGDVHAIKSLCEPAVAEQIVARLGEKGLVKTSDIWVREGGWPAPSGGDGTAYFGLEGKGASGKVVPFRIDLVSWWTSGNWVWRINGITFDVKY
jgi:hypothetical protein